MKLNTLKLNNKLAIWFYAFFLQSGYFKSDFRLSWLPVDLTILAAFFVFAFLMYELLKTKKIATGIIFVLLFFVLFLPGLFTVDWTPYTQMKTFRFYTQTLLVAITPFFFISTKDRLREFLKSTVVFGLLVTIDVVFQLIVFGGNVWKITAFGSSVIAIGRSVGLVVIYYGLKLAMGGERRLLNLVLLSLAGIVVLVSGQRMAIVGPVLTLIVTLLLAFGPKPVHIKRMLIVMAVVTIVVASTFSFLPQRSGQRIERHFSGGFESFVDTQRGTLLLRSLEKGADYPFGLGLGGVFNKLGFNYPHNLFVETFVEGGWLAAAFLCLLLLVVFVNSFFRMKYNDFGIYVILFGFLTYSFFYSMVAGDINGNRMVFALVSICLINHRTICCRPNET